MLNYREGHYLQCRDKGEIIAVGGAVGFHSGDYLNFIFKDNVHFIAWDAWNLEEKVFVILIFK